jgi:hypothetical protein
MSRNDKNKSSSSSSAAKLTATTGLSSATSTLTGSGTKLSSSFLNVAFLVKSDEKRRQNMIGPLVNHHFIDVDNVETIKDSGLSLLHVFSSPSEYMLKEKTEAAIKVLGQTVVVCFKVASLSKGSNGLPMFVLNRDEKCQSDSKL